MDKKQKEALIIALAEKGETYRDITKKADVSPNTIKAVLNRAGLDESTSIYSRAFELFSEGKTPLQVAITLNLEAEIAIQYHQQYYMLLGCTEFTTVYLRIKENPWQYVNLVKLIQDAGMSDDEVIGLLEIAKRHLSRVKLEFDRLKAELNSLEDEKSNSAKEHQRLCNKISEMERIINQLQIAIKNSKEENSKLELQKIRIQNFVKEFRDNNIEYNKVKQAIEGQIEYILADRKQLLRMAIQSVIELLRLDPQKFHSYYYNRSTINPKNEEEPALVEAERLYEKMLENITNKVVTSLSDNISSMSSFALNEPSEPNSDNILTFAKEERTLSDPEDKRVKRNLFKERPDVPAGHRMISYPNCGQAFHPNFDELV